MKASPLRRIPLFARIAAALLPACSFFVHFALGQIDPDSLSEQRRTLGGSAPGLRSSTLDLGDGARADLSEIAGAILTQHAQWDSALRSAPKGALFSAPQSSEEVLDIGDGLTIVKTTRVVVKNPGELAARSPAFADFLGERPAPGTISPAGLSAESRQGLEHFMSDEVPRLPADHPLRIAAAKGQAALLDAISQGEGEFEIVDSLTVPKVAGIGGLQSLALDGGERPMIEVEPPRMLATPSSPREDAQVAVDERRARDEASDERAARDRAERAERAEREREAAAAAAITPSATGTHSFRTEMMAGFTRGNEWRWERRWNYPSGFFRITLGGSYGLGLRIPIEVTGDFQPTNRIDVGRRDTGFSSRLSLQGQTVDAGEDFFRRAGMPANKLFRGNEVVMELGIYFGYRFRAFWTNIAHRRNRWDSFRQSQDFDPPFGAERRSVRLEVPPSATGTELGVPGLSGYAQVGFNLAGRGTLSAEVTPLLGGRPAGEPRRIQFSGQRNQSLDLRYPAGSPVRYGFRIDDPAYRLSATITPQLRIGVRAGCDGFSRNFNTGWLSLNSFAVDLPNVRLTRHEGTRREYAFNDGRRVFYPEPTPTPRPTPTPAQTPTPTPRPTPRRSATPSPTPRVEYPGTEALPIVLVPIAGVTPPRRSPTSSPQTAPSPTRPPTNPSATPSTKKPPVTTPPRPVATAPPRVTQPRPTATATPRVTQPRPTASTTPRVTQPKPQTQALPGPLPQKQPVLRTPSFNPPPNPAASPYKKKS